jgi:hypothetical protein
VALTIPWITNIEIRMTHSETNPKFEIRNQIGARRRLGCWRILCSGLFLLFASISFAQPLNDLIFTVGTTISASPSQNWSYVLIGAPQPQLLAGKRFAIFSKPGFPTNAAAFTLRTTLFQQTDATAVNNLLNQSVMLNENLASLNDALNTLLHKVPGATNLPLAQKVLTAFSLAGSDPLMAQSVLLFAQLHPGLKLCAGQAFAEPIAATTTYEVRDVNLATGVAGDVLGRVTLTPGAPVVLPAPGFPFQVVTNAPSDDRRIRLRWGTPDALRRLALLQYGFNVWRIPTNAALAGGFNVTPPTPAQLASNPNFLRVNAAPVMTTKDYAPLAGPGGPNDPSDRTTYFFADDNGRFHGGQPFMDGTNFYYFITARDLLGRDGFVSPVGLATACRRLPPLAPRNPRVQNTVAPGTTNQQRLLVTWAQNNGTNDLVAEYWVYRWPNPTMAMTNDLTPLSNRVAVVLHVPGVSNNACLDNGPGAPGVAAANNFWYTVRAVSHGACVDLLSPHSPPAWGVLRERAAPPATTGELLGSCGTPVVAFQNFNMLVNAGGADSNHWNYRFTCQRRDRGIAWVEFIVTNSFTIQPEILGPVYFPPDGDTVSLDYSTPVTSFFPTVDAACVVGTYYGLVSQSVFSHYTNAVPAVQRIESVFLAGELLLTALSSSDPLLNTLNNGQSFCVPGYNVTPHADGTVSMQFDASFGSPMLVQFYDYLSPNSAVWRDIAVATPDPNGFYSVYWEPCLVGPLPPFRGCRVNLPGDADCSQHITSTGGGSVAPIRVRFRLTPRTHEYRLYRRVNDGPLTLVAQGAALFDPLNPNREIVRTDDAMPPSRARFCYFVQVLDENGNGSPMALIGCKDVKPPKPPRPVLGQPVPAGDTNNPQVALTWFCPTSGVYRFEVKIERADQPGSGKPTGFNSLKLIKLVSYNPQPRYAGLFLESLALAHFDESQLTPPVGPNFGPGPQFTLTASVVPNVPYHISVAAQDDQGNSGDPSQVWTFTWKPPVPLITVLWPARPLPPAAAFDDAPADAGVIYAPRVAAVLFTNFTGHLADTRYPVGIRFAKMGTPYYIGNVGTTNLAGYNIYPGFAGAPSLIDPNGLVFQRLSSDPSRRGAPLLPIVVYRQQVTNANFPRVSGNLTQVTPLLERVSWSSQGSLAANGVTVTIADRLIAANYETISDRSFYFLYLRDQQPVILGASYQYFVVRLNDKREVAEIIPAGTVTIPSTP